MKVIYLFLIITSLSYGPVFSEENSSKNREQNHFIHKLMKESYEKAERERKKQVDNVKLILYPLGLLFIFIGLSNFFATDFWIKLRKTRNELRGVKTRIKRTTVNGIYLGGIVFIIGGLYFLLMASKL
ncbi:MAG: hypothetical protein H7A25_09315 [Leptospiraceae bacterium]|nr:hypothetical protein [Leptospiraceae bacterium]